MTEFRKSTLYDLSGLRLQEGASRVNPTASEKIRPSQSRIRLKDSRGNWVARDAGGRAQVPRFKRIPCPESEDEDTGESAEDLSQTLVNEPFSEALATDEQLDKNDDASGSGYEDDSLAGKKRKGMATRTGRLSKKLRFSQGLDYLIREAEKARVQAAPGPNNELPLPTSELLKFIHHEAGRFYSEHGLLHTSPSRSGRRGRKMKNSNTDIADADAGQEAESGESDRDNSSSEDSDNSSSSGSATNVADVEQMAPRSEHLRDMYKSFDGSALLALGILVQEFIKEKLEERKPAGREEMLRDTSIDDQGSARATQS